MDAMDTTGNSTSPFPPNAVSDRRIISRTRDVQLDPGQSLGVTVVRKHGGRGRLSVRLDFDPEQVADVRVEVRDGTAQVLEG